MDTKYVNSVLRATKKAEALYLNLVRKRGFIYDKDLLTKNIADINAALECLIDVADLNRDVIEKREKKKLNKWKNKDY